MWLMLNKVISLSFFYARGVSCLSLVVNFIACKSFIMMIVVFFGVTMHWIFVGHEW